MLVVLAMFLYGDAFPSCKTATTEADAGALPHHNAEASAPLIDDTSKD